MTKIPPGFGAYDPIPNDPMTKCPDDKWQSVTVGEQIDCVERILAMMQDEIAYSLTPIISDDEWRIVEAELKAVLHTLNSLARKPEASR